MIADGRLRLDSIDVGERTIASHLHLAAGGEVTYWLGGFDDDFGSFKPSLVALVEGIGGALRRGDSRFDLGPGAQDYKYRLADGEDQLCWATLVPPGPRRLLASATLVPQVARRAVGDRLTPERRERLKALGRRLRPTRPS
jgi:CelD/BcsL family acetyltransferase involved in cellulose biosynthesis